jgi:hypothetical protein
MIVCCPLTQITYQLKRSARRRTIGLKIAEQGLVVFAPSTLPQSSIDLCMLEKKNWIIRHLQRRVQLPVVNHLALGKLPLLDEELTLQVVNDHCSAVTLEGQQLWVQLSARITPSNRQSHIEKLVTQWYERQAELWFAARLAFWQQQLAVQFSTLKVKQWRRKWGSCDTKGVVSLNWRLLLAPSWVADYVVVHELVHLRHMNHSAQFWQLVAATYPQYKQAEAYLREHQHRLFLTNARSVAQDQ